MLFDKWSLKDILAHIIGWEKLSVEKIQALQNGTEIEWISDVNKQNEASVNSYKNKNWNEVYQELVKSGEGMIKCYQSLPENLWDKQAGPDPKYTPRRFIEQETRHYQGGHLQEIERFSET